MANSAISKISKRAKQIRKAHPGKEWRACIEQASREYRAGHKITGTTKKNKIRQTGHSNRHYDEQRAAKAPGKRRSATGKTYYERRKNRSDRPGKLTGTTSQLTTELKRRLIHRIDRLVLQKYHSTRVTDKRRLQKKISELKAQLRKLL